MRITIEIDDKSGTVPANSGPAISAITSPAPSAVSPAAASVEAPPPDVLTVAAATGAINAGPAPTFSQLSDSAPHPFVSRGGAISEATRAAAVSAGSDAQGKPCA
jgi:hypothetical protein